ncbi:hypothetical protein [Aestuariivirga sp.]|uniref:hypothetical protein n=1 Tax=Aestuariivirga sp. TaxID=2650926 RepID=UPI0039E526AC
MKPSRKIDFARINARALASADSILVRWLPDGRREGTEWVALNPRRSDKRRGSFKVNLHTGKWGDFAAGASGGDLVSLAAYLFDLGQGEAALKVSDMLGVDPHV